MQAVSREILLSRGLPGSLELKKGGVLPQWFTQVAAASSTCRTWWQIYLDNFLAADVKDKAGAGADQVLQGLAMHAWDSAGVLTAEDKQVLGNPTVTELGLRVDGTQKLLGSSPERLLKTMYATLHFIRRGNWSKKEAQIILGRWVFILQYRRAAMSVLARSWEVVEMSWPSSKHVAILHQELWMLMCLGPLLQQDLTSEYDGQVHCSDASESGGACAISNGLSWSGRSLVGALNGRRVSHFSCIIFQWDRRGFPPLRRFGGCPSGRI